MRTIYYSIPVFSEGQIRIRKNARIRKTKELIKSVTKNKFEWEFQF